MLSNKGSTATMTLFAVAFIALVATAFLYEKRDSTENKKLLERLEQTENTNSALLKKLEMLSASIQLIQENQEKITDQHNKAQEKIAWLEMKSQNSRSLPNKIHLTLDPIQTTTLLKTEKALPVSIAYRTKKAKKPVTQDAANKTVIKNIKSKLQELSN